MPSITCIEKVSTTLLSYSATPTHRLSTTRLCRPHIYLFHPEDLDNDNVIAKVEDTPTYKRTKEILESINSLSNIKVTAPELVVEELHEGSPGTIKFL